MWASPPSSTADSPTVIVNVPLQPLPPIGVESGSRDSQESGDADSGSTAPDSESTESPEPDSDSTGSPESDSESPADAELDVDSPAESVSESSDQLPSGSESEE